MGVYVAGILVAIGIVWVTIDTLAARYFLSLMAIYEINPAEVHEMFLESVHRYLVLASILGLLSGVAFAIWLTRRVLDPLTRMGEVTRRVAAGDYSARTGLDSPDEIGRLARAVDRMAEDLARAEELRRRTIVDVAHELRTPLTNIRGYLEGVSDGVVPASAATLASLQEETARLSQLVEDLLELARAEAAVSSLQVEAVEIETLLDRALEPFRASFAARSIALEDAASGSTFVEADPSRLARAIRNLLQNSLDHTPRGGRLRIEVRSVAETVEIAFENTVAEPIAPEHLPRLFERFYRVEASRAREGRGGAGIGLAIVDELIRAHTGSVRAETVGNSLRIVVRLPQRRSDSLRKP